MKSPHGQRALIPEATLDGPSFLNKPKESTVNSFSLECSALPIQDRPILQVHKLKLYCNQGPVLALDPGAP